MRSAIFASACKRLNTLSIEARAGHAPGCVNTSLSWTLFFSLRWCIRDEVHLDSRVHAANKLSHYLGGQHGQESEEVEEGEERSEEDCEEDPQGRQEEEVSLLDKIAGRLLPVRH
jgi:hypothetical protein